jgi:hypothetical protein
MALIRRSETRTGTGSLDPGGTFRRVWGRLACLILFMFASGPAWVQPVGAAETEPAAPAPASGDAPLAAVAAAVKDLTAETERLKSRWRDTDDKVNQQRSGLFLATRSFSNDVRRVEGQLRDFGKRLKDVEAPPSQSSAKATPATPPAWLGWLGAAALGTSLLSLLLGGRLRSRWRKEKHGRADQRVLRADLERRLAKLEQMACEQAKQGAMSQAQISAPAPLAPAPRVEVPPAPTIENPATGEAGLALQTLAQEVAELRSKLETTTVPESVPLPAACPGESAPDPATPRREPTAREAVGLCFAAFCREQSNGFALEQLIERLRLRFPGAAGGEVFRYGAAFEPYCLELGEADPTPYWRITMGAESFLLPKPLPDQFHDTHGFGVGQPAAAKPGGLGWCLPAVLEREDQRCVVSQAGLLSQDAAPDLPAWEDLADEAPASLTPAAPSEFSVAAPGAAPVASTTETITEAPALPAPAAPALEPEKAAAQSQSGSVAATALKSADVGTAYRLFCLQSESARAVTPAHLQNWLREFFNTELPVVPVYRNRIGQSVHERPVYTTRAADPHAPAYWLVSAGAGPGGVGGGAFLLPAFSRGDRFIEVESAFVFANERVPTPTTMAALEPAAVTPDPQNPGQWLLTQRGRLRTAGPEKLDEIGPVTETIQQAFLGACRRQTEEEASLGLRSFEKELDNAGLNLRVDQVHFWLTSNGQPVFVKTEPDSPTPPYWLVTGAGADGLLFPAIGEAGDALAEVCPEKGFLLEGCAPFTLERLVRVDACKVLRGEDGEQEWFQVAENGRCVFRARRPLW